MKKVSELFDIKYGNALSLSKLKIDKKGVNFVSRGSKNNGVSAKVQRIENINPIPLNSITVSVGGSVLETFVQDEEYYTGYHVLYLKPKIVLSKQEMLYYCLCIRANKYKYSYGRQANKTLGSLLIPDIKDIPSWVNQTYIPEKPSNKSFQEKNIPLKIMDWGKFKYSEIFKIEKGYYNKKPSHNKSGKIRFIGASRFKNGITSFHDEKDVEKFFSGNCITVANDGNSVTSAFYQNQPFTSSHSINILTLKDNVPLNIYIGLFLCTLIRFERYRFGFGRKWRYERMLDSIIKLPITKDKKPDYKFMETYIKSLPYSASI